MRKSGIVIIVFFCSLLLTQGCATTANTNQVVGDKIIASMTACLNKLTKDELIMKASTPTEKVPTDDGEIWVYKYRRSETKVTAEGAGSILFPVEAESKSQEYSLDVMLRFNKEGKFVQGSYRGNAAAFSHPFADLDCQ